MAISIMENSKYDPFCHEQFAKITKELDKRRDENILDLDERFEDIMTTAPKHATMTIPVDHEVYS
jgi:hypothetical protein